MIGRIKKLNSPDYNTWQTCMKLNLQGRDLWEVVGSSERTLSLATEVEALRKLKIKAGKAMFAIRTTVEDEMLEHIRNASSPKEAWDIFITLFSKKNDARLQLLENNLLSTTQGNLMIDSILLR